MPIAKVVSSDGPISIYYELHGRISTARDDLSVTNPFRRVEQTEGARPNSLSSASDTDPELGRIKRAIGSAAAADRAANASKKVLDRQRTNGSGKAAPVQTPKGSPPGAIEMTDMSSRSRSATLNGLPGEICYDQAAENDKPSKETNGMVRETLQSADKPQQAMNASSAMNGSSARIDSAADKEKSSAAANEIREDEHIIEMPHEDADTGHGSDGVEAPDPLEAADPSVCTNVLFICGMSARGRTEFFEPVVSHLASLASPADPRRRLLTCCTFDNRGIGNSTVPDTYAAYKSSFMAADALALLDHLGWLRAHVIGMSLGGMVGCKLLASAPSRVASLTMLSTTTSGWNMACTMMSRPWITLRAGAGPLESRIPANLRANFSPGYLSQKVDGKTRAEILSESTYEAIRLGLSEKFLAEGQPEIGRNGHVLAAISHRLSRKELRAMRAARVPMQMINGRHDLVAGLCWVKKLAKQLNCPLILTDGAHAGICLETPAPVVAAMERIINIPKLKKLALQAADCAPAGL